jgi:hypothetical protein
MAPNIIVRELNDQSADMNNKSHILEIQDFDLGHNEYLIDV